MQSKQIKIKVPEPCHEDWNKMTPKDKGAFCGSCAKVVVDFTKMSDRELIAYLEKSKGQKTCGKFSSYQLDRKIIATNTQPNYLLQLKKYLTGLFFGLSFPALTKAHLFSPTTNKVFLSDDASTGKTTSFKGTVLNEFGLAIEGAQLSVYQQGRITEVHAITSPEGFFTIETTALDISKNLILKVSASGYETIRLALKSEEELTITMNATSFLGQPVVLGKMMVEDPPEPIIKCTKDVDLIVKGEMVADIMGDVVIDKELLRAYLYPEIIRGEVLDEFGSKVAYASVSLVGQNKGVFTDQDGFFELKLSPQERLNGNLQLSINAVGYAPLNSKLKSLNLNQDLILFKFQISEPLLDIMGIMIHVPIEEEPPSGFDKNYQEPKWMEEGFESRKAYQEALKGK